jgi:hypothetical protein
LAERIVNVSGDDNVYFLWRAALRTVIYRQAGQLLAVLAIVNLIAAQELALGGCHFSANAAVAAFHNPIRVVATARLLRTHRAVAEYDLAVLKRDERHGVAQVVIEYH